MHTCVRKSIGVGVAALLLSSVAAFAAFDGKKDAVDGGMTYPRKDGKYTVYRYNDQKVGPIHYGRAPTKAELKAWDTDILPDGTGLPVGKGSVERGDELFEEQCAVCHGDFGAGGKGYPTLTGGDIKSLTNQRTPGNTDAPQRTIGTYWPKASTLLWYIHDAMPYAHPKSLSWDDTYAITAYLLATNDIKIDGEEMDDDFVLSNENFTKIHMPNENGFIPNIDGPNGPENVKKFLSDPKNIGALGKRCMHDCEDDGAKLVVVKDPRTDVSPPFGEARDLPPKKKDASVAPGQEEYEANCKVCHGTDAMGAPVVGNKEDWEKVMKKGMDKVLKNAINGTGAMPPRGGTDLSDDKIKEIIEYMYSKSK
ncbi:MAG: MFS transporter [Sulfurospirillum sp.]|nr:MAG: MFS transporter [Sulfurospirillum sp.]